MIAENRTEEMDVMVKVVNKLDEVKVVVNLIKQRNI